MHRDLTIESLFQPFPQKVVSTFMQDQNQENKEPKKTLLEQTITQILEQQKASEAAQDKNLSKLLGMMSQLLWTTLLYSLTGRATEIYSNIRNQERLHELPPIIQQVPDSLLGKPKR